MKKPPHWFRWVDLVTLGGGALVTLGALVYVLTHEPEGKHLTLGLVTFALIPVLLLVFWVRSAIKRKEWLDKFRWIPKYNLMMHRGGSDGYLLPADEEVNNITKHYIDRWENALPGSAAAVQKGIIWVYFSQSLSGKERARKEVKGYTYAYSRTMAVAYDFRLQGLQETAYGHELGHIILGTVTKKWDEAEHHAFMQEHDLS